MKRILICEDEPDVLQSLKKTLEKMSYEVFIASDGQESLELVKRLELDLVLLDIRMPKVDGLEVAKEIRKFDARTKIIFITAFQGQELPQEAAKYAISDYIVKPVSSEQVLKAVEGALKD
jgi:CheY-like chemotaxis protein